MASMNYLQKLKDFYNALYKRTKDWRSLPNQQFVANNSVAVLRANLIMEEANELKEALETKPLSEVRKELADLLYVTFGTAVVLGINADEDFLVVHANNMLKIKNGTVREDGKLVKSVDHPKVTFENIQLELWDHVGKVTT